LLAYITQLIDASKEVGLEVNASKTKYTLLSLHQNTCQIRNIKTANRSFERVAQSKYMGTRETNLIREEIKKGLN
jgi:hypothetical protein